MNNQAGAELESHLKKKLRSDAFLTGVPDIEINARFRPDPNVDLPATVRIKPDKVIDIQYDLKSRIQRCR